MDNKKFHIPVFIHNKVAMAPDARIVCGNGDYVIDFHFDEDWDGIEEKTALFTFKRNNCPDQETVTFSGSSVDVPVLHGIRQVNVGVYARNLQTTTGAKIPCEPSILDTAPDDGEVPPTEAARLNARVDELKKKVEEIELTPGEDGKDGVDGKSAYDIAVEEGFEGTKTEWLNSLKGQDGEDGADGQPGAPGTPGADGKDGADGKSAYQYAQDGGYTGTEEDFAKKLAEEYPTPDWNASEGETGHVLNRTHGEWLGLGVLYSGTILTKKAGQGTMFFPSFAIVIGKEYEVTVDGATYKVVAYDDLYEDVHYPTMGAPLTDDGGYDYSVIPWQLFTNPADGSCSFTHTTAGEHEVVIKGETKVVHKLPSKFIDTPDLNAAEGEPGHVLNRTHYVEGSMDVLFDGEFAPLPNGGSVPVSVNFDFVAGKVYTVTIDDVSYVATAWLDATYNIALVGATYDSVTFVYDFSEFPFSMVVNGGNLSVSLENNPLGTHTLKIVDGAIHKLPGKFIPSQNWNASEGEDGYIEGRTHYVEESVKALFDGTYNRRNVTSSAKIELTEQLTPGVKYTLVHDGITYEAIAFIDAYGFPCIGAPVDEESGDFDYSEFSFSLWYTEDGTVYEFSEQNPKTGEHTLSVLEVSEVVHRIDEKYLPLLTSPNGTKYLLTVSDNGTLTATPTA